MIVPIMKKWEPNGPHFLYSNDVWQMSCSCLAAVLQFAQYSHSSFLQHRQEIVLTHKRNAKLLRLF